LSCHAGAQKISRLACQVGAGITQLAGKRSFYAGVAVGVTGTLGTQKLAAMLRRRNGAPPVWRAQLAPAVRLVAGGSTDPAASVPVGTRANPRPISKAALDAVKGSRANPRSIPVLSAAPAPVLETRLRPAPIQVRTSSGQTFTPRNSYQVVKPDGTDTGLAITPYVREGAGGQPVEDETAWGVTHTRSGSLIGGPYESLAKAQGLATKLSYLRWTAPVVPAADVAQARQMIDEYQQKDEGVSRELR
jgi:hypothetical protein